MLSSYLNKMTYVEGKDKNNYFITGAIILQGVKEQALKQTSWSLAGGNPQACGFFCKLFGLRSNIHQV